MMKTFEDFDEAKAALPDGFTMCGCLLKDGSPRYFHAPEDATEDDVRKLSFQIREGRPMSEYEEYLLNAAESLKVAG